MYDSNKMFVKDTKAPDALYVKNIRVAAPMEGCVEMTSVNVNAEEEEDPAGFAAKDELEKRMTGNRACVVDWEDLVHRRLPLPLKGTVKLGAGESVRFEFPGSSMNQQVPYQVRVWAKGPLVGPLEEKLEKTVKKGRSEGFVCVSRRRSRRVGRRDLCGGEGSSSGFVVCSRDESWLCVRDSFWRDGVFRALFIRFLEQSEW